MFQYAQTLKWNEQASNRNRNAMAVKKDKTPEQTIAQGCYRWYATFRFQFCWSQEKSQSERSRVLRTVASSCRVEDTNTDCLHGRSHGSTLHSSVQKNPPKPCHQPTKTNRLEGWLSMRYLRIFTARSMVATQTFRLPAAR